MDTCWAGIMERVGALLPTPSTHLLLGLKMKKALGFRYAGQFVLPLQVQLREGAWAGPTGISASSSSSPAGKKALS